MSTNKRLSIPASEQTRKEFEHVATKHNLTQEQTLEFLLNTYREAVKLSKEIATLKQQLSSVAPKLSKSEIDLLDKAVSHSGLNYSEILRNGFMNEIKAVNSKIDRVAELEKQGSIPDKLKGSALARINIAVNKIMAHNDSQTEIEKKFFISETAIQKLTGSNRSAIKEYMELYKGNIAKHNNKHNLTATGNLKAKGYDIKTVLGKAEKDSTEI